MRKRLAYRITEIGTAWRDRGIMAGIKMLMNRLRSDAYGLRRRCIAYMRARNGVVVMPIQGSLMALRLDDPGLSRSLIRDGVREPELTQLIQEEISPGMVGVDIGANLGYYALMEARLVGPKGLVLAIEPVPQNYALLKKNILLNNYPQVEVYQLAIGDCCGTSDMWLTPESNLCNLLSPNDVALTSAVRHSHTGADRAKRLTTPTLTLDQFLHERGMQRINFIRMDIEGYEIKATKGMLHTFRNATQVLKLFVEVHNGHFDQPRETVGVWVDELLNLGFRPKAFAIPGLKQRILRDLPCKGFSEFLCTFRSACPHVLFVKNC